MLRLLLFCLFYCIGFIVLVLQLIVILLNIFFCLLAAIRSSRGEEKRYPLTIEFIKDKSLEMQVHV